VTAEAVHVRPPRDWGTVDSLALNTAIGLVFVFATFAMLTSTITESAARWLGLRGEYLLRGIRTLTDGGGVFKLPEMRGVWGVVRKLARRKPLPKPPAKDARPVITKLLESRMVVGDPAMTGLPPEAGNRQLTRKERRKLPSYVSARAFARGVLDIAVPNADGSTTLAELQTQIAASKDLGKLQAPLLTMLKNTDGNITQFRLLLEEWYDDQMARVSGWYKRHVRWISLAIATALAIVFNVNAVGIGQSLYTDEALRGATVSQAVEASDCGEKTPAECLGKVRKEVAKTHDAGLPIGWGTVQVCVGEPKCSWADKHGLTKSTGGLGGDVATLVLLLLGYVVMIVATLPGARFWFDLLGRFGSLRSSGPKPPPAASSSAAASAG
jgi:hypothetical protein